MSSILSILTGLRKNAGEGCVLSRVDWVVLHYKDTVFTYLPSDLSYSLPAWQSISEGV